MPSLSDLQLEELARTVLVRLDIVCTTTEQLEELARTVLVRLDIVCTTTEQLENPTLVLKHG
jgi:hypothetical protein